MGLAFGLHRVRNDPWNQAQEIDGTMVYASKQGEQQRPLRYGMVGGGRDAFIGAVHRMAIRLDGEAELVAGALCSDAERSRASAADIGIAEDRGYGDYAEMAKAEGAREDGIEAVVIVTPNHLHAPVASAFLETGVDIICDKPLTATLAEAEDLVRLTRQMGRVFAVTLTNSGFPMVRQMREMIAGGALGKVRGIHTEYVQDWLAQPIDAEGQKQAEWRTDPARAGLSSVLGDIGVHAMHLAAYATGLEVERVAADLSTAVEGRRLDDNANLLMRWEGGVPGTLIVSQTAYGHYNDLSVRIYGEKAGLRWSGLTPEVIEFTPMGEPTRRISRGGPGTEAEAQGASRMPAAHAEGYIEAFANFYRDAFDVIRVHRAGGLSDRAEWVPMVEDGARGIKFVAAAVASHTAGGSWTDARLEIA